MLFRSAWNISWVLLQDFDRKIEDAPRRCEICATPDDRRPKSQSCQELLDRLDEDENLLSRIMSTQNFTAIRCSLKLSILQSDKRKKNTLYLNGFS